MDRCDSKRRHPTRADSGSGKWLAEAVCSDKLQPTMNEVALPYGGLQSAEPSRDEARAHPAKYPTNAEISRCVRLLEVLLAEPDALAQIPDDQRKALLVAAGRLSRPIRHERERVTKAIRRYARKQKMQADLELRRTTQIRDARTGASAAEEQAASPSGFAALLPQPSSAVGARQMNQPQSCYICKRDYTHLDRFYDAMCPDCAEFNYRKRTQTAKLDGRVALVTGARIKIGFHASLMLLRAGARVIGTTRFPHDAAARFASEPDYDSWRDRLTLYGLDLRFCPSVERFAAHLGQTLPGLDFLVNNAAQTVHRPNGFFSHLQQLERRSLQELPEQQRPLLATHHELCRQHQLMRASNTLALPNVATAELGAALPTLFGAAGTWSDDDPIHFPPGRFDHDGQQLDLRQNNSWRLKAAEVSTPELIEVHLVNAIAPFILVSRLKELMQRSLTRDKHVVNVSAMEGVFARRTKTDKHPHTNMAKASLNMLTRTSAKDYVRDGIHMNSVDTGWVTDEDPHPHAVRKRRDYDFSPPLDAVDGAARICDPIFTGFLTGEHPFGQFFKDYRPAEW
jgi:NAD(P)-dependent dehydrogenase (short-subunit alcohol dehydrogenase family)